MRHAREAEKFLKDESRTDWHDGALWYVREKRDAAVNQLSEWEWLREMGSRIKDHTLSKLDQYLIQFEENATSNGIKVHWAADALEHNRIVREILDQSGTKKVVKSKSMLTEECGLNEFLETQGFEIIDTDLGERIIQMRHDRPSHIVLPAIHLRKEDVGQLFQKELDTEPGNSDPTYLTRSARAHLRNKFLEAGAAITGVNFAIAETGGIVICTNEGNADMGVNAAPVQIHSMGLEKVIPRETDLGVFTRLLARSATGQAITIYTSHYQKPKAGGEMHVIIVDNGRSEHLGRAKFKNALKCIRCGACMNTCPIYRRSSGHSYMAKIPGPIGSILTPGFNLDEHKDLPFASTLCGSCSDVCPVKINIHEQLYEWRQEIAERGKLPRSKGFQMRIANWILSRRKRYAVVGKVARFILKYAPRFLVYNQFNTWGKHRELPPPPEQSFRDWYRATNKHNKNV